MDAREYLIRSEHHESILRSSLIAVSIYYLDSSCELIEMQLNTIMIVIG